MSEITDDRSFLIGLVAGTITGAAIAAMLVPLRRADLPEQVAERGVELKGRAEDVVRRAQQVASETVSRLQASAQRVIGSAPTEEQNVGGSGI